MVLSKRTKRWIQNIERFCDVDYEKAVVTMHFHFESVSEIRDENLSNEENLVINDKTIKVIQGYIDKVPEEFKLDLQIAFEEYEGYDLEVIRSSFLSAMEIQKNRKAFMKKKRRSKMGLFILIGFAILILFVLIEKINGFAFAGITMSAVLTCFLELFFEIYFEEGIMYFTIFRILSIFNRGRLKRIESIQII